MTLIETGTTAQKIIAMIQHAGYACPGSNCGNGFSKDSFSSGKPFVIEQLDSHGFVKQSWELQNWFIKGARFGEMNYESDEFVAVEITIGYDCAVRSNASIGNFQGAEAGSDSARQAQEKYRKALEDPEGGLANQISKKYQEANAKAMARLDAPPQALSGDDINPADAVDYNDDDSSPMDDSG